MKTILVVILAMALMTVPCYGAERPKTENPNPSTAQANAAETLVLKTDNDKLSYAVGVDMARNFIWSKVQPDQEALLSGLSDAFAGKKLLLNEADFRSAMDAYLKMVNSRKYNFLPGNVSYAIGVDTARKLKPLGVEFNMDALARGLGDMFSGKKLLIDGNELRLIVNSFQLDLKHRRARTKSPATKDVQYKKAEGDLSLAEKNVQKDVMTLPSGLQYRILKTGNGRMPAETDMVEINYRGTLNNGTEFDSSYRTGRSATFPVKGLIPGLKEALQRMPVGSKWQLFIPPQLAYGQQGSGRDIGPNETLIYEVELIAIK